MPDIRTYALLPMRLEATDVLGQSRGGVTPQTFRLYGTATDSANFERLAVFAQNASEFVIASQVGGTGAIRNINLNPGGADIAIGKGLILPQTGGAATLGVIGSPGPATTTQNAWLRLVDATGFAMFLPVWK